MGGGGGGEKGQETGQAGARGVGRGKDLAHPLRGIGGLDHLNVAEGEDVHKPGLVEVQESGCVPEGCVGWIRVLGLG